MSNGHPVVCCDAARVRLGFHLRMIIMPSSADDRMGRHIGNGRQFVLEQFVILFPKMAKCRGIFYPVKTLAEHPQNAYLMEIKMC